MSLASWCQFSMLYIVLHVWRVSSQTRRLAKSRLRPMTPTPRTKEVMSRAHQPRECAVPQHIILWVAAVLLVVILLLRASLLYLHFLLLVSSCYESKELERSVNMLWRGFACSFKVLHQCITHFQPVFQNYFFFLLHPTTHAAARCSSTSGSFAPIFLTHLLSIVAL